MKVIHINPTIGNEASGPSYSVPSLHNAQKSIGINSYISTLNISLPSDFNEPSIQAFKVLPPIRLGRSRAMYQWLDKESNNGKIIFHNHGTWQFNGLYPSWIRNKKDNVFLIYSPRGTLSKWSLSNGHKRLKNIFWHLYQKKAIMSADMIHATSFSEYEEIRDLGFINPVCIIPNGVDVIESKEVINKERTVLFLGRLHPKKGIEDLIRAWAVISKEFPAWKLKIVGTDEYLFSRESYKEKLLRLCKELAVNNVIFLDPVYGNTKHLEYKKASIFILPTYSENFGMTVAESLSNKTPAIVSKGAPWKILEDTDSGWWIDIGIDPIIYTLRRVLNLTKLDFERMGLNGQRLVKKDFSWDKVASNFNDIYSWVIKESLDLPEMVKLD